MLVRAEGRPDAAVIGRLQQGTTVTLLSEDPASAYCELLIGEALQGHVACRFLSTSEVAPQRAGQGDVPADRRWSAGSGLLLRAAPEAQAAVLARLPVNTELRLLAGRSGGAGYCEVSTLAIGPLPAQQGHTACALLAESPLLLQRLEQPLDGQGKPNPAFNPRKLFAVRPSWASLARYQAQQLARCPEATACAAQDADFAAELTRMRRLLHGQRVALRDPMPVLPRWLGFKPELDFQHLRPVSALSRALQLPPAAPSWFRSETELAGPQASMAQLAQHFESDQQWFVGALYASDARLADARIERLGRSLQRIELLGDGSLRDAPHTPQFVNRDWQPDNEVMCRNWPGTGFAFGDNEAATWRRNGFEGLPGQARPAAAVLVSQQPAAATRAGPRRARAAGAGPRRHRLREGRAAPHRPRRRRPLRSALVRRHGPRPRPPGRPAAARRSLVATAARQPGRRMAGAGDRRLQLRLRLLKKLNCAGPVAVARPEPGAR